MVIVTSLEQQSEDNALHFTTGEADCVATRVTRAISDDRLRDLGVVDRFGISELDFSPDEETVVWDALEACVDLAGQVAETLGQDSGLSAEQAQCMAGGYVAAPEFREAIFSEGFDPELNARIDAALAAALQACTNASI